jgi:hypothetical protein
VHRPEIYDHDSFRVFKKVLISDPFASGRDGEGKPPGLVIDVGAGLSLSLPLPCLSLYLSLPPSPFLLYFCLPPFYFPLSASLSVVYVPFSWKVLELSAE